ncbi:MAG: glycosyltransferase family 9 protein [Chromatiales bacterium]|jgi:ADP-heptose:LPS heptosyltransferase|nr:glycosyltransferase family 9 protein [Chromatiales bacterium]
MKDHVSLVLLEKRLSKILLIRVGRVGDMVMVTPAVQALLDHYPQAEFHLLTSRDGQRVFRDFAPRLQTLLYDRHSFLAGIKRYTLLRQVRSASYDIACCFELNPSFAAFTHAATRGFTISNEAGGERYAQLCLDLAWRIISLTSNQAPDKDYRISLPVTDDARERARALYAAAGITPDTFVVGLHPTYSGLQRAWRRPEIDAGRRWPQESFAELARALRKESAARGIDLRVVMDLLPEEAAFGEQIVRLSDGAITLLTPTPDFARYKAMLERMNLLVTTDTGAMHVAGAVGTRLVALFGVTNPASSGAYVAPGQCIELHAASRRMADITPNEVLTACRHFLPA